MIDTSGPEAAQGWRQAGQRLADPAPGRIWIDTPQGPWARQLILARLKTWLREGIPPREILLLLPQRDRRETYRAFLTDVLDDPSLASGVGIQTYYGLASSAVRLLWPDISHDAGFARPLEAPVFLTYETAQYLMSQIVQPLLADGYFDGLALRPQRVLSQLLDNLNKAAVNGYPIEEVGPRLKDAFTGDRDDLRYYDQAQSCIEQFRGHCLRHNLVDVSLAVDLFHRHLRHRDSCAAYLSHYHYLAVEGVEESVPVAQDFLADQIRSCEWGIVTYRRHGGFRVFLGVDPTGAQSLRADCGEHFSIEPPPEPLDALAEHIAADLQRGDDAPVDAPSPSPVLARIEPVAARHRAEMIERVASEVRDLVARGDAAPGDIAIVAPYADGVLRYVLERTLREAGIPFAVIRRFESLREEGVVRGALALAALCHAGWSVRPHPWDVAEGLAAALGLDPVRSAILCRAAYDRGTGNLRPPDELAQTDLPERLSEDRMGAYAALWRWIVRLRDAESMPLDHLLRRLFGEVLSHPALDPVIGTLFARFISSAEAFRKTAPALGLEGRQVGERYTEMVAEGVVAAAYETPVTDAMSDDVLVVAPVTTYLLDERRARYQFWLDIGSIHWWAPPHQPLTNPHVLGRHWPRGRAWTDRMDSQQRDDTLVRLVRGLCARATERVYLCWSEVETAGESQDSPLLHAVTDLIFSSRDTAQAATDHG